MARHFQAIIHAAIGRAVRTAAAPLGSATMTSKAEARIRIHGIQLTLRVAAVRPIWSRLGAPAPSIALLNEAWGTATKSTARRTPHTDCHPADCGIGRWARFMRL